MGSGLTKRYHVLLRRRKPLDSRLIGKIEKLVFHSLQVATLSFNCLSLVLSIANAFNLKSLKKCLFSLGQSSQQAEAGDGTNSPRSGVFHVLRASSEPDIRDIQSPPALRFHGRPRDSGPDGASDTAPITGKEREFTPILGKLTAMDSLECLSPSRKHFIPERDLGDSPGQRTEDRAMKTYYIAGPVVKRSSANTNSEQDSSVALAEKETQRNYVMHERAPKQKPLQTSYKRCAPSPAFSVKSYESDQYSELPTVIHVSRRESSGSKDSNSSIPLHTSGAKDVTSSSITPTASDIGGRQPTQNRITKLVSRDRGLSSSPSLPSKPRIDVRAKRVQKPS